MACRNGPAEIVLSGATEEMQRARALLMDHGIKATLHGVPYAFHSSQVGPILDEFEAIAANVRFERPRIRVLSPLLDVSITEGGLLGPAYLRRHLRETANMEAALRTYEHSGPAGNEPIFLELGPHSAVSAMVKQTLEPHAKVISAMRRGEDAWNCLTAALSALCMSGHNIRWMEYHNGFPSCRRRVLQLPAYSWDARDYWIQYAHDWSLRKGDALPTPPCALGVPSLDITKIHKGSY